MKLIYLALPFIFSSSAFGHGKEKHLMAKKKKEEPVVLTDSFKTAYAQINIHYKKRVEPIFKGKCFDCHSSHTTYPWYYQIPGIKILITSDIKEARAHIDMDNGFPFRSHSTPLKDLVEIERSILDKSMPPLKYRILHRDAALTKKEVETIKDWTQSSKKLLKDLK
jgi:hypothetical protein